MMYFVLPLDAGSVFAVYARRLKYSTQSLPVKYMHITKCRLRNRCCQLIPHPAAARKTIGRARPGSSARRFNLRWFCMTMSAHHLEILRRHQRVSENGIRDRDLTATLYVDFFVLRGGGSGSSR